MADRSRRGEGLTRPELAVLLAYAKRRLQQGLSESPLCDDPILVADLEQYFPPPVVERFGGLIAEHPLRRELVATRVANNLVNTMGIVFVSRVMARTGSDPAAVVAAYLGAREVTGYASRRAELEALAGQVDPALLDGAIRRLDAALEAVIRRYLAEPAPPSPADWIERDRLPYARLEASVLVAGTIGQGGPAAAAEQPAAAGLPEGVARHQALLPILSASPDILEVASGASRDSGAVADLFVATAAGFGLGRLADMAGTLTPASRWDRWAAWSIEDDLAVLQRMVVERLLAEFPASPGVEAVGEFRAGHGALTAAWEATIEDLPGSGPDPAALMVALRRLRSLLL
jgi:glutamate dehydrogenase